MDNFKERRSDNTRGGKRERASFNPNFGNDNRLNRSRYNKYDTRPQFARNERRENEQGGDFGRYKSYNRAGRDFDGNRFETDRPARPRYGAESRGNRYQSQQSGGYRGASQNRYSGEQHGSYGKRGGRTAYDPNAKYSAKKRMAYKEAMIDPNAPVRLNKFLANAGICSRREADNYIEAGLVTVNGVVVTELGTKVVPTDDVRFNAERINPERKVYVLLNKPKDCVTTVDDPQERKTVLDCLRGIGKERIYPVGRLDRNTTGVLLLTNDGDLASKLTHPKFMKKKVYHVTCDKNVAMSDMDLLVNGIELEDGPVYADEVTYVNDADRSQIGIEIHSGKNRIVRRMMEHLGYRVQKLDRVLFAGLTKKNLKRGDWRYLTEKEVNMLRMGAYE
ncbi:MAG: rRNA pseudouridine synthase [Bacteroidaceae bacterium]|nr:rRNA pseudouridine synthase [Bacteroidaceae bacterium]